MSEVFNGGGMQVSLKEATTKRECVRRGREEVKNREKRERERERETRVRRNEGTNESGMVRMERTMAAVPFGPGYAGRHGQRRIMEHLCSC